MNVNESLTRMLMIKEYLWTNRLKNVRKIISIQTQKQKFWLNYMKHLEKKRWDVHYTLSADSPIHWIFKASISADKVHFITSQLLGVEILKQ